MFEEKLIPLLKSQHIFQLLLFISGKHLNTSECVLHCVKSVLKMCNKICISPYLVRMLENTDQKNSEYEHFSCSVILLIQFLSLYVFLSAIYIRAFNTKFKFELFFTTDWYDHWEKVWRSSVGFTIIKLWEINGPVKWRRNWMENDICKPFCFSNTHTTYGQYKLIKQI